MQTNIPLLDEVKVAAPCPKRWEDMIGGDRVRFCRDCSKNVYNLSEMTKDEAEQLLQTHEGRLCVQFYRRGDGKILTQNCPVGLRAIRRAFLKQAVKVSTLCSAIFGINFAILFPMLTATGGERAFNPQRARQTVSELKADIAEKKHLLAEPNQSLMPEQRKELEDKIESDEYRIEYYEEMLGSKPKPTP